MNARETLKLISKQWCDINDLMKLAEIGKNNAVKLRREIKDELILKGYTLQNNRLPMIEVVNKLKINQSLLKTLLTYKIEIYIGDLRCLTYIWIKHE